MQQPFWKRWFSYLREIHIESAPSELNEHLYVSLKKGRYQLSTANGIYSFGDLYKNFKETFEKIKPEQLRKKNVLILGFGLGSIPILLEKITGQTFNITAIEIDEAVIYLANKYALDDIQSHIQIIEADAYAFCAQTYEKYDLIVMDVFQNEKVPEIFESAAFLEIIDSLLLTDGLFLFNRLAHAPQEAADSQKYFENVFLNQFPNGAFLYVWGNWMLMNEKNVLKDLSILD